MSRQERYENVVSWAKKIRKGLGKGDADERRRAIRPPDQVAFRGFAVWQCAKGTFVIARDGRLNPGDPKQPSNIARYSDFASAWKCALNVGPYGVVIYAGPGGTVFVVG